MNVFVLFLLLYLLYRFIGGFLIPLFRTSRHMRQQFHDMNGGPKDTAGNSPNSGNGSPSPDGKAGDPKSGSSTVGEYIDFEEVR